MAESGLMQLVAGLLLWKHGFNLTLVNVGFLVGKVALEKVSFQVCMLALPCQYHSNNAVYIHSFICHKYHIILPSDRTVK